MFFFLQKPVHAFFYTNEAPNCDFCISKYILLSNRLNITVINVRYAVQTKTKKKTVQLFTKHTPISTSLSSKKKIHPKL